MLRKFKLYVGIEVDRFGGTLNGNELLIATESAESYLIEKFGGFTQEYARGSCGDKAEKVNVYTVFTDKGPDLHSIAQTAGLYVGHQFNQHSVLVETNNQGSMVYPNYGNVRYFNPEAKKS